MIQRNKPSGFFVTADPVTGRKIEGETRQCVHCQYTWIYRPGSGIKRGWCNSCNGLLCGSNPCIKYHITAEDRLWGYEKKLDWNQLLNSFRGAVILGRTEEKKE